MSTKLEVATTVTVYIRGTRYAISGSPKGPGRSIPAFEVHGIDARGLHRRIPNLSAELDKAEEFYLLCIASGLRSGMEFARDPGPDCEPESPEPESIDPAHEAALSAAVAEVGATIGGTLHPRASTDRAVCQHPRAFPVLSQDAESCPDCGAFEALGSL